jgi:hypothetical protein
MPEVLEQPMTEDELIAAFEMPPAKLGDVVLWYWNADKGARKPIIGLVTEVSKRNVGVYLLSAKRPEFHVRHMDDPKLAMNESQREAGGWRHTEARQEQIEWRAIIEQRIDAVEVVKSVGEVQIDRRILPAIATPKKAEKKKNSPISAYHDLRKKAQSLGIEFTKNPTKDWLNEQIAAATKDVVPFETSNTQE